MTITCWLIGDCNGNFPIAAAQFADLRRLRIEQCPVADGVLRMSTFALPALVATDFQVLGGLRESQKSLLKVAVESGTTAYLRGGFARGRQYSLEPFTAGRFAVASEDRARGYFFARHPMVPGALRGESSECELSIPGADVLDHRIAGLLFARHSDGRERPVIFVQECGAGRVIYDLQPDAPAAHHDLPILRRLGDRVHRCADVGALLAVERACSRDESPRSAVNLTIDDRPANFDYLNAARLRRMLEHLAGRLPRFHIDFAWTPSECHPSRRYVALLKQFGAGFVWHGLCRHVDHRVIANPAADLAVGKRLVNAISHQFGVDFQPVMIFPFERAGRPETELLKNEGFVAKSETPGADPEPEQNIPPYLRYSGFPPSTSSEKFAVLYRYHATQFGRDLMLAHAALGLPIIAMAHPGEIGLKRFARLRSESVVVSYFDHILDFAAEKSLRPRSLEKIAREVMES